MPSGEHPFDGDMILIKNKNKNKKSLKGGMRVPKRNVLLRQGLTLNGGENQCRLSLTPFVTWAFGRKRLIFPEVRNHNRANLSTSSKLRALDSFHSGNRVSSHVATFLKKEFIMILMKFPLLFLPMIVLGPS